MLKKGRFKRLFRLRFAVIYPFGVFAAIFFNPTDDSILAGMGFVIAGLLIRLWANGYGRTEDRVTTEGPYSFMRHPLYTGTMLIAAGFAVMAGKLWLGLFFVVVMALFYYRTIKNEEKMLLDRFKEAYLVYMEKTNIIIPRITPYQNSKKAAFSFKQLLISREHKTTLWVIIMVIAFHLKGELLVEHEPIDTKIAALFVLALILGSMDLILELVRKRRIARSG